MKTLVIGLGALFLFVALPVFAEPITRRAGSGAVIIQQDPPVITTTEDQRQIEGEIVSINYPESRIVVQDVDGRDQKVILKQGMINNYKVGDYVQIYLMSDLKEAQTIRTKQVADLEGDIVSIDYMANQIIVREPSGGERIVLVRPVLLGEYRVGDYVRLYVVSDYNALNEAKMIRVK